MKKQIFFVECTDLFAGETNYTWVHRYKVKAVSERGVAQIMGRKYGRARNNGLFYKVNHACVAWYFVDDPIDESLYQPL